MKQAIFQIGKQPDKKKEENVKHTDNTLLFYFVNKSIYALKSVV